MPIEKVDVKFSILGADNARQDLGKIRTAAEEFGDAGVKGAQRVTDAFGNIQKSVDTLEKKIAQGKTVTSKDVASMAQQFELLKEQINAAFGSLDQAPVEIQQAFKLAEQQVGGATSEVRK